MALEFAKTSYGERLKVGCLLIKGDQIISQGVNGMPSGWETNICEIKEYYGGEDYRLVTKPECRHAEINCLNKLRTSNSNSVDSILVITHAPCLNCAIELKAAKVQKVIYLNKYRLTSGLDYLYNNDIEVEQLDLENV